MVMGGKQHRKEIVFYGLFYKMGIEKQAVVISCAGFGMEMQSFFGIFFKKIIRFKKE